MTEQTKERMGHEEWLRFKAWVWLVGGTEAAQKLIGVHRETFERLWQRHWMTGQTMARVREAIAGRVHVDAVA